jgi:hypothetical protein
VSEDPVGVNEGDRHANQDDDDEEQDPAELAAKELEAYELGDRARAVDVKP